MKYVFFNDISILYELKKGNPKVHYIGVLEPMLYESDIQVIPITFPFPAAHIWWPTDRPHSLMLKFEFKSIRNIAVLAAAEITLASALGFWEVSLSTVNSCFRF